MLLDLKRLADALNEYEVSMHATPKRLRGLYGAAKAADRVQDKQKAQFYYGKLVALTQNADTGRPELRAAEQYRDQH